jgi:succinate-semialdehyde dehydrogenase/glutarate-semialdehyde dehydrogenase
LSKYATTDPATGLVLREFETMADGDVDGYLEAAHAAYLKWRRSELAERSEILQQIANAHRERSDELARLMTVEMGKPVAQAKGEVALAASIYEYYATKGPGFLEEEQLDIAGEGSAIVRTEPIGALVGIMPWNYPYYQVARFVAPNLLLGNTILLKHASNCPQQALQIADIISDAGAPVGVYQNLFATNEQIATMIASPLIRGVSLTGSERAGQVVGGVAGAHMKKCVLELGGSDPFIVLADADVAFAAREAATGRFANAGPACTSSKRILVEENIWDTVLEEFLAQARNWTFGDPSSSETKLGPMASLSARADLEAQVDDAVARGATVHLGGTVPDGAGAFYPATVLSGVDPTMRAYREAVDAGYRFYS